MAIDISLLALLQDWIRDFAKVVFRRTKQVFFTTLEIDLYQHRVHPVKIKWRAHCQLIDVDFSSCEYYSTEAV